MCSRKIQGTSRDPPALATCHLLFRRQTRLTTEVVSLLCSFKESRQSSTVEEDSEGDNDSEEFYYGGQVGARGPPAPALHAAVPPGSWGRLCLWSGRPVWPSGPVADEGICMARWVLLSYTFQKLRWLLPFFDCHRSVTLTLPYFMRVTSHTARP